MAFMEFQGPGFVMQVPTDWLITSSTQFQVMFLSPPTTTGVRPNLMITIRPVQEGVSPAQIAEESRKNQQREYPDYTVLEEIDFSTQGGFGFLRRYSWQNPEQHVRIIQIQCFFVVGLTLYTLTATRLEDDANSEAIDTVFDHMIQSFRLTAPLTT